MTARATFTQAELARAIRAAEACGKVAVLTPEEIASPLFLHRKARFGGKNRPVSRQCVTPRGGKRL